jgi:soluble lytic murein transglycosylase-like protein
MPNVPYSPVPGVVPSTSAPGDYLNIQASPNDFGAQIGQAEERAGSTLQQTSDTFNQATLQKQQVINNVGSDAAFNKFQSKTQDILYGVAGDSSQPGYYSLRGQAAVDARPGVLQALDEARTGIRDGLPNQVQQLGFDESSRRLNMYSTAGVGSHSDQEFNRFAIETQTASLDIKARAVANAYNDDELFQHNLADAALKADAKSALSGANPDTDDGKAVFQNNRLIAAQTLYTARAVAMGTADPAAGLAFVKQNITQFDAITGHRLVDEFKAKANIASDNSYVSRLLGGNTSAPPGIYNAISGQEGSGDNAVSVDGARGKWQIMPATFKQYAEPGEDIGTPADNEAVGHRYIDDIARKPGVNGDPARIAVGYFSGPDNIAPPGSTTPWIEDKKDGNGTSTSSYVAGVMSRLQTSPRATAVATPGAYPDESALIKQTISDNPDPERQAARLSKLTQALGTLRLSTETDRKDLTNSLPDLQAAALDGKEITIPTERINHLLPPADAAKALEQLDVAQQAGLVFKSVQYGTPEQVNAAYQDLSSGMGPISTMIRAKGQPAVQAGTAAPGSDQESPEAYRLRLQIRDRFKQQLQIRLESLSTDPAGYVAAEPNVTAAAQAVQSNPNDPAALSRYVTATQAVQTSLGVPEYEQHILTLQDARTQTHKLTSIDPSKADMGQALSGLAQQYGAAWPKVFGDLVTLGHLPGDYQVLAAMPDPVSRTDFQRALSAVEKKNGGFAELREEAPPQVRQDIDTGLPDKMADFRRTATIPGLSSNDNLVNTVWHSIRTLAYYYALRDGDGVKALDRATNAVINDKYDFDATMRVPKGMLPVAESATANLQANLKPEDLYPMALDTRATDKGPGMTIQQRQEDTLKAAKNGTWTPNESDTGLILVSRLNNGTMIQMRRADGSRIEMPFKGMTASTPSMPATTDLPGAAVP